MQTFKAIQENSRWSWILRLYILCSTWMLLECNNYMDCHPSMLLDLSVDGKEYLSKLKVALQRVNRKLHHNITKTHPRITSKRVKKPYHHSQKRSHSRQKWFSLIAQLFGLGVYMNVRNIRKIKQNLQILQNQNDLQESQILELTHYLNLTMIQVWEHCGFLCKLDVK